MTPDFDVPAPFVAPARRLVAPFPQPGSLMTQALDSLRLAGQTMVIDQVILDEVRSLPRPWDPASCDRTLRNEIWVWLDKVATWINSQSLWSPISAGIPECWPAHPFIVHELAVAACSRLEATVATNPVLLQQWFASVVPGMLERIQGRLGDGCQPGRHEETPRGDRDSLYFEDRAVQFRRQRFEGDLRI